MIPDASKWEIRDIPTWKSKVKNVFFFLFIQSLCFTVWGDVWAVWHQKAVFHIHFWKQKLPLHVLTENHISRGGPTSMICTITSPGPVFSIHKCEIWSLQCTYTENRLYYEEGDNLCLAVKIQKQYCIIIYYIFIAEEEGGTFQGFNVVIIGFLLDTHALIKALIHVLWTEMLSCVSE